MKKLLRSIFSMLKIGCIGFGGGNALIPIIQETVVEDDKIITAQEYEEDIVIANITPGALPVELAYGVGKRSCNRLAGLACATSMALPGMIGTILLLSVLSSLSAGIITQLQYITVGITAFIASLLSEYVIESVKRANKVKSVESHFLTQTILIILAVFGLTCGKNLYRILGISSSPIFGISTIHIFVVAFFLIFYLGTHITKLKSVISILISFAYLLCVGKNKILTTNIVYDFLRITMLILALHQLIKQILIDKTGHHFNWKPILKDVSLIVVSMGIMIFGVGFISAKAPEFLGRGFLSSIMSFGGGDAYLTVADGMFVDTGLVTEDEFYRTVIPTVNILPGSILCKALCGMGYYVGLHANNSIVQGIFVAICGFMTGVIASCGVFSIIGEIYHSFEQLPLFQIIKKWIRAIVSGLMMTVNLTLIYQNIKLDKQFNTGIILTLLMFAIWGINQYLHRKKVGKGMIVLFSIIVSAIVCNLCR